MITRGLGTSVLMTRGMGYGKRFAEIVRLFSRITKAVFLRSRTH